jgi:hypothetical protein
LTQRIDNILEKNYQILIGDANGADKAVQKYLFEKDYKNVVVFCMGNQCRNNIGRWQSEHIHAAKGKNGFDYYSTKDLKMAMESDYGFMIWDAISKGTLNNIINLLKINKKTLVYFCPEEKFYDVRMFDDLKGILSRCSKESLEKFEKDLNLSETLNTASCVQPALNFTHEESMKSKGTEMLEEPVIDQHPVHIREGASLHQ